MSPIETTKGTLYRGKCEECGETTKPFATVDEAREELAAHMSEQHGEGEEAETEEE